MPDPVDTQLTQIDKLETELGQFIATPSGTEGDPESFKGGTAAASPTLATVSSLLELTYDISGDIKTVGGEIAATLNTAAATLKQIANTLGEDKFNQLPAGKSPSDIVQMLQAALATAQTLIPGGSPAIASGSQFFAQIADLLKSVGNDTKKAQIILYKLAQEFDAIAVALKPKP